MGRVHKKKIAEFIGADIGSDAEAFDESDGSGGASEENGSDNRRKRSTDKKVDEDENLEESDTSVTSNKRQKPASKASSVDKADEDTTKENEDSNKKQSRKPSVKAKRGVGKDNNASEAESTTDEAPKKRARKTVAKEKTVVEEDDDEKDAEPEYEVEAVIDQKTEKGTTYYLLTWKGYPKEEATWEPEDSISCPDLVEKFKKKRVAESAKGSKKGGDASKKGAAKKESKKTATSKAAKAKNGGQIEAKDGEATEYEVEKIVDYSNEKTGRIFRIRWKGYRPKHDTWEPEENLTCPDLIEKFLKQVKEQESNPRELREEPKKTKFLVDETQPRTSFRNRIERSSQRSCARQRKFYGDAEN